MEKLSPALKLLVISSYPPRQCGIATFANDIVCAIEAVFGDSLPVEVCALESEAQSFRYNKEVTYVLHATRVEEYREIAEKINERNDIGLICIQHEFGLFGGTYGDYLFSFLLSLNKPIVTVFHTVLPHPSPQLKKIVQGIADLSNLIIVLTESSRNIMEEVYGYSHSRIQVIPHGTHIILWEEKARLKNEYNLRNKKVFSTFGLLSENKGIETVLKAMPAVIELFPQVVFFIIGKTHPEIVKREGEKYRGSLEKLVVELDLVGHVIFIQEYLPLKALLEYLTLTDIYLFSSKDPYQAVSGTLAYALSAGCAVVATPIPHAVEYLNGAGLLLDHFDEPNEFQKAILQLLDNPGRCAQMARNGYVRTHASTWENTAIQYGLVFGELSNKMEDLRLRKPAIKIDHIQSMTTDIGMLQFANFSEPDPDSGYTLDDNARALIDMVLYFELFREEKALQLASTYLSFLVRMQRADGGFDNYLSFDGTLTSQNKEVNLEDSNARALWSLGVVLRHQKILPDEVVKSALCIWEKSVSGIMEVNSPRAIAYILKGIYQVYLVNPENETLKSTTKQLADKLMNYYHVTAKENWLWYEDYLSYANNVLPEAMLVSYLITGETSYKNIAIATFDFLLSHYFMKGKIQVVSKSSWFKKKNDAEFYGEQPIEVVTTIVALDLFYQITGNEKYKSQLEMAYSWFLGNNHLNQIMYNPINGAAYDGLEDAQININQGAESTLCFLKAQLIMTKYDMPKPQAHQEDMQLRTPFTHRALKKQ